MSDKPINIEPGKLYELLPMPYPGGDPHDRRVGEIVEAVEMPEKVARDSRKWLMDAGFDLHIAAYLWEGKKYPWIAEYMRPLPDIDGLIEIARGKELEHESK